jgi:hypothetical protein
MVAGTNSDHDIRLERASFDGIVMSTLSYGTHYPRKSDGRCFYLVPPNRRFGDGIYATIEGLNHPAQAWNSVLGNHDIFSVSIPTIDSVSRWEDQVR